MAMTMIGTVVYFSPTPASLPMSESDFDAVTNWVAIGNVGRCGPIGAETNTVSYDALDTVVSQQALGVSRCLPTTIEFARVEGQAGQDALLAIAGDRANQYAFRRVLPSGEIDYFVGWVSPARNEAESGEDFDRFAVTVTQSQIPIRATP